VFLGVLSPVEATKPRLPLEPSAITGEWIGQSSTGHLFRLQLRTDGTATLGFCNTHGEGLAVYASTHSEFDGYELVLTFSAPYGEIRLSGPAYKHQLSLDVRGVFGRKKRPLTLVREGNLPLLLKQLESSMSEQPTGP
jgi:hypothetical protein